MMAPGPQDRIAARSVSEPVSSWILAVLGLCLGASFAPSHEGMPIVPPTAKIDFFRRQVLMSRNVRSGLWMDFFLGGLNYYPDRAPPVSPTCRAPTSKAGAAADP